MVARPKTDAREKILKSANDLFYRQGYNATTVDQVIEHSGISKPTMYAYFPTKEDLCVAYLEERRNYEARLLKESLRKQRTPKDRFLGIIKHVRNRIIDTEFRGCGFFNMVSEIPDTRSPIVKEARIYIDDLRGIIRDVVTDLKNSEARFKSIDVDEWTDRYYLIIGGAIMGSQEYRENWPTNRAIAEVERMVS